MERTLYFGLLCALCVLVGVSCGQKLSDEIKKHPQLTKFTSYLEKTNTDGSFSWSVGVDNARTVYAPINAAWDHIAPVDNLPIANLSNLLQSHFVSTRQFDWASMEREKFDMNKTQLDSLSGKKLLMHEEHGNYFVSGAMFVTDKHTSPTANEIPVGASEQRPTGSATLFLIDRVIFGVAHKDNFYNHMKKEESRASEFAKLVDAYGESGPEGKNFIQRLSVLKGTLFVPKALVLTQALIASELDALRADTAMLKKVLESHLVEDNYIFTRYFHEEVSWTTAGQPFISHAADPVKHPGVDRLLESGGVTAELKDSDANITMSNGVMHFIDAILQFKYTAYTIIGTNKVIDPSNPGTSTPATGGLFMKAIQTVPSVMNLLRDRGEAITVFAPTSAFTASSEHFKGLIDAIAPTATDAEKDASELARLLNAAIVKEKLTLEQLKAGVNKMNVNGTNLISKVIGEDVFVEVNGVRARIIQENANIEASNGVVHVIDKVLGLKGTNLWEKLTGTNFASQLTAFNQLVKAAGMDVVLADANLELTVFAPTDSAIEATKRQYADQSPTFEQFLEQDKYSAGRKIFVQRHIVAKKTKIAADSARMTLDTMNKDEVLIVEPNQGLNSMTVSYKGVRGNLLGPYPNLEADNGYLYRVQSGALYSLEDPKVGQVGTGAASITWSLVLVLFCAFLGFLRW